jgi:ferrochelatase
VTGVLLVNLGTPDSPRVADVRRYLREFLSDPRVIDVPALWRWLLVHAVILPFRPRRSARAYAAIWTDRGSPLLVHSRALAASVAKALGEDFAVELGMRYGRPSIPDALERLAGAERLLVLPLFPQYASSSSGSALEAVLRRVARRTNLPELETLPPFCDDPGFVSALAERVRATGFQADHLLLSFHGLPERQVRRADPSGALCLAREDCCDRLGPDNRRCYRAQCFATARALATRLELAPGAWSVAFQSRLGRTPWIRPFTEEALDALAARGVRRLAVACPSFVADCLETVEEIGIRGRERWLAAGGEAFELVPCVNAEPGWVETVAGWIRARA